MKVPTLIAVVLTTTLSLAGITKTADARHRHTDPLLQHATALHHAVCTMERVIDHGAGWALMGGEVADLHECTALLQDMIACGKPLCQIEKQLCGVEDDIRCVDRLIRRYCTVRHNRVVQAAWHRVTEEADALRCDLDAISRPVAPPVIHHETYYETRRPQIHFQLQFGSRPIVRHHVSRTVERHRLHEPVVIESPRHSRYSYRPYDSHHRSIPVVDHGHHDRSHEHTMPVKRHSGTEIAVGLLLSNLFD